MALATGFADTSDVGRLPTVTRERRVRDQHFYVERVGRVHVLEWTPTAPKVRHADAGKRPPGRFFFAGSDGRFASAGRGRRHTPEC